MALRRLLTILVAMLLALGACSTDSGATSPDADEQPTTPAAAEYTQEEQAQIEEAESRARAYVAAVNEGRIDELAEIIGAPLQERDERHFQFHAALNASGTSWNLGECEVATASVALVRLECEHSYTEPVFVAAGAGESTWPFTLTNDELVAGDWVSLGNAFTDALGAYRDYMLEFHPADYALCDPAQQTGDFSEHGGIARVPECAPAMIEHQDAVIKWMAGQPTR